MTTMIKNDFVPSVLESAIGAGIGAALIQSPIGFTGGMIYGASSALVALLITGKSAGSQSKQGNGINLAVKVAAIAATLFLIIGTGWGALSLLGYSISFRQAAALQFVILGISAIATIGLDRSHKPLS